MKNLSAPRSLRVCSLKLLCSLLVTEGRRNRRIASDVERNEKQACSTRVKSSQLITLLDNHLDPAAGEEQENQTLSSQVPQKEVHASAVREGSKEERGLPCEKSSEKSEEGEGGALCMVLLTAYDSVQLGTTDVEVLERRCVVSALSSLLAISHSAKHSALEGLLSIVVVIITRFLPQLIYLEPARF